MKEGDKVKVISIDLLDKRDTNLEIGMEGEIIHINHRYCENNSVFYIDFGKSLKVKNNCCNYNTNNNTYSMFYHQIEKIQEGETMEELNKYQILVANVVFTITSTNSHEALLETGLFESVRHSECLSTEKQEMWIYNVELNNCCHVVLVRKLKEN